MTSALHKRLEKLETLVAARVAPPIWRFVHDPYADTAAELERMVADGEVAEKDKHRVQLWRWLTREEADQRGMEPDPLPAKLQPQPQLPAPPELKLLPSPASVEQQSGQQPTPPQVQAKRPLTEDQLRKLLEDRERPFGRPIRYPKGMVMP
jgi:hypothetical protein